MKIQLIKIPRKIEFVVLGVLFMFSSVLLAREGKSTLSSLSTKIKQQNQQIVVSGKITSSDDKMPIPGVNVTVKGNTKIGVVSDINGEYKITLPSANAILIFSSVGMKTVEKKVDGKTEVNIVMSIDQTTLQEVIIVGFGQQKKESVVGAISQVSGKVLQRTGGVTSLGAALTGNLPGVTTLTTTGSQVKKILRLLLEELVLGTILSLLSLLMVSNEV